MNIEQNTWLMINLVVVIVFALLLFSGYKQGFLMKLISIVGFVVVGIFSWWISAPISRMLSLYPKSQLPIENDLISSFIYDNINRLFIFVVLFVILNIVILFLKPLIKAISDIPVVSTINKVAGLCLGAIQAVVLMFVATLVLRLPFISQGNTYVEGSLLKYSEPMMNTLMFYAKEPLQQISAVFDLINEKETLTKQEVENIHDWLVSQNLKEEQVNAIMAS
ncbi:CvpA family protein [Absiella sp. AM54-8XD]|nr:CvpA family protein [Absiella sp. AM54-8XD]RGC25440.1 CvpA family protein [Absiella sp. AM54-8XD]